MSAPDRACGRVAADQLKGLRRLELILGYLVNLNIIIGKGSLHAVYVLPAYAERPPVLGDCPTYELVC